MNSLYPFTAIVGHDDLKQALLLCAINPLIGGILLRGEKKHDTLTAVRGLAGLLPRVSVSAGCARGCDPVTEAQKCPFCRGGRTIDFRRRPLVTVPPGANIDQLCGTIMIEAVHQRGESPLRPGLLAAAHRGFLFADEACLSNDHLTKLLLDTAAGGEVAIRHEGYYYSYKSRFVVIGAIAQREERLQPRFFDRFGLCVSIPTGKSLAQKAEMSERTASFAEDPETFCDSWLAAERLLEARLGAACERLALVKPTIVTSQLQMTIAEMAGSVGMESDRAIEVVAETARALAAWDGKLEAGKSQLCRAAELTLLYRCRSPEPAAMMRMARARQ